MADFEEAVKDHSMVIELDSGVHRSLYFSNNGGSVYHFRINTWPGHLCISGDMGTYVFSRLEDMFEFFRGDKVNLSYWSEKIQSESRFGSGVMEFSQEKLVEQVREWVADTSSDVRDEVEESLIPYITDVGEGAALNEIYNFSGTANFSDFFTDLSPWCYRNYTVHFEWCCEAIVWAIKKYDEESVNDK